MFWHKKKPTIEFFSLMPEVAALQPVVSARNFRPDLLVNAGKNYADLKKDPMFGTEKIFSTARCPGIYNYVRHGWVICAWQDITITTNGDGESFTWSTPLDQRVLINGNIVGQAVNFHPREQYANHIGGSIPNSLAVVLKIMTPWRCIVPEGYYLQEGNMPYSDEKRFTTVTGFFSRDQGVAQMNIQLLWHVLDGTTVIKAGTPLAHYMLIPKEQPELVSMAATPEQVLSERITNTELNRQNITNMKERKCIFAEIFK
jgi:hypothetical protein